MNHKGVNLSFKIFFSKEISYPFDEIWQQWLTSTISLYFHPTTVFCSSTNNYVFPPDIFLISMCEVRSGTIIFCNTTYLVHIVRHCLSGLFIDMQNIGKEVKMYYISFFHYSNKSE